MRVPLSAEGDTSWYPDWTAIWAAATGGAGLLVASVDAPPSVKEAANFVCDGVADQVEINTAIDTAAPLASRNATSPAFAQQAGTVWLSGGRFIQSGSILQRTGVQLAGCGELTEVMASGVSANVGYPNTNVAQIKQALATDHAMHVRDLWLNGNFAAGGTACHGLLFAGPGGAASGYPDTNPDPANQIRNVRLTSYTGGTRHALWLQNNCRATHVHGLWVRDTVGAGFFADATPDGVLSSSDFGGCGQGIRMEGANWRITGCKTFFSGLSGGTGEGLVLGSGRHTVVGFESQDDQIGITLSGIKNNLAGITIDCAGTTGLSISGSRNAIASLGIYQRAGGRFATTTNGLVVAGTPTDLMVVGWIEKTNGGTITNPVVGNLLTGARNFVRLAVDNPSALLAVG